MKVLTRKAITETMIFVYPIILYFLSSTTETMATDDNYAALAVDKYWTLMYPSLQKVSRDNEDQAPAYGYTWETWESNLYYFFCPAQSKVQLTLNEKSRSQHALFFRLETAEHYFLDQPMPKCERPILSTIQKETYHTERDRYSVGFEIYPHTTLKINQDEIAKINKRSFTFLSIFDFRLDETAKTIKSVEYNIRGRDYIPAGSNKGNTNVFHKNIDLLETDVDERYEHFRDHLLPRMTHEKFSHPTAHRLGIRKVSLIPSDDFLDPAWKKATYADVITTPIWSILLFKWNAVEIFVRKLIRKHAASIIVNGISGTLDVVEKHYHHDDVAEKKLHVPKYVWKIVSPSLPDKEAILIVMHNDPFSNETTSPPLGCAEDCTEYGWLLRNDDYRTGLIYCCRVNPEIVQLFDISLYKEKSEILDIIDGRPWEFRLSDVVFNPTKLTYDW